MKRRLGEILIDAGLLKETQLKAALSEQRKWGGKLGRTLVEMGFVDEQSMMTALSKQLHLPTIDLDQARLPAEIAQQLRIDVAERYGVFPVGGEPQKRSLQIATSDPTNAEALKELGFHTGMKIQPVVATGSAIDRAIRRYYYGENTVAQPAAVPQDFGVDEPSFEPSRLTEVSVPAATSPQSELAVRLAQLTDRVAGLDKLVATQVRAMRGMLELLVEKGVVSREEYLKKVRGEKT